MKFLSTILVLGGYILIYAAVANKGKFAKQPWIGVFRDAYGVDTSTGTGATTAPSAGASTTTTTPPVRSRVKQAGA